MKISINTEEGIADFNLKSRMLESQFSIATLEAVYTSIFGSTDSKCTILPTYNTSDLENHTHSVSKVSYQELPRYIDQHPLVALYPTTFFGYDTKNKKYYPTTLESIEYINDIIVDIDGVTANELPLVLHPIMNMKIQPNFVVNSGHGIHIHYVLSEPYPIRAAIGLMARYYGLKDTACQPSHIIYHKEFNQYLDVFKNIKKKMISWFDNSSATFHPDDTNLALPIRMFCSKTKNPCIYTVPYIVSDVKHSLEDIAEFLGFVIPDTKDAKEWSTKWSKQTSKRPKKKIYANTSSDLSTPVKTYFRKKNINIYKTTGNKEQYNQFVYMIKKNAKEGNRRNSLYVFWQRAPLYTKNKDLIKTDYASLVDYFQTLSSNPLTTSDIEGVLKSSITGITNKTIFEKIGHNVRFENKEKENRANKKSTKEQIKNETIEKCKSIFEEFGKISLRELSDLLKKEGCDINYSTLSRMEEIKILLQKCILKNNKTINNYNNINNLNSNIDCSLSLTTNPPLCSTILQQRRLNQSDSNLVAKVYPDENTNEPIKVNKLNEETEEERIEREHREDNEFLPSAITYGDFKPAISDTILCKDECLGFFETDDNEQPTKNENTMSLREIFEAQTPRVQKALKKEPRELMEKMLRKIEIDPDFFPEDSWPEETTPETEKEKSRREDKEFFDNCKDSHGITMKEQRAIDLKNRTDGTYVRECMEIERKNREEYYYGTSRTSQDYWTAL